MSFELDKQCMREALRNVCLLIYQIVNKQLMKKQTNKFIAVSYQLHADENEGMTLVEEATEAL